MILSIDRSCSSLGFGIVKLIALPFGGIGVVAWFWGFLLVVVVLGVLVFFGRRQQRAARAKASEQRAAHAAADAERSRSGAAARSKDVPLPPFWSLVEAHGDELLVHARRLAGDEHAEDVLQDALLRALRAYPRLRTPTTCAPGCTASRRRRRSTSTARAGARSSTDEPPVRGRAPTRYDDGAFESLIAPLPETARRALRLRFVDDLDYDGIADRLGCSTVAARQRVSTAVRTLRESFA